MCDGARRLLSAPWVRSPSLPPELVCHNTHSSSSSSRGLGGRRVLGLMGSEVWAYGGTSAPGRWAGPPCLAGGLAWGVGAQDQDCAAARAAGAVARIHSPPPPPPPPGLHDRSPDSARPTQGTVQDKRKDTRRDTETQHQAQTTQQSASQPAPTHCKPGPGSQAGQGTQAANWGTGPTETGAHRLGTQPIWTEPPELLHISIAPHPPTRLARITPMTYYSGCNGNCTRCTKCTVSGTRPQQPSSLRRCRCHWRQPASLPPQQGPGGERGLGEGGGMQGSCKADAGALPCYLTVLLAPPWVHGWWGG